MTDMTRIILSPSQTWPLNLIKELNKCNEDRLYATESYQVVSRYFNAINHSRGPIEQTAIGKSCAIATRSLNLKFCFTLFDLCVLWRVLLELNQVEFIESVKSSAFLLLWIIIFMSLKSL